MLSCTELTITESWCSRPMTVDVRSARGWILALLALALPLWAGERVEFEGDVWPILEKSCIRCHGGQQHYSNLRLDSPQGILRGGELGRVVVPGEPEQSTLYLRPALPPDDLDFMPVEDEALTHAEQQALRQWIAQGADFGAWTGADGSNS